MTIDLENWILIRKERLETLVKDMRHEGLLLMYSGKIEMLDELTAVFASHEDSQLKSKIGNELTKEAEDG